MTSKNLFIFIGDSLRYDFFPDKLSKFGTVLKTAAHSLYTPTSIASIVTSKNPQNHNVRHFFDALDPKIMTIFRLFQNGSYYDHPEDPMSKIVLKYCPRPEELTNMKEPFVWIERALETHIPYGEIKHGNNVDEVSREDGLIGSKYKDALYEGRLDTVKEYQKGVDLLEEHFLSHIRELEKCGFIDDTLVIFTSDHGEVLGEYSRFTHGYPPCKELVLVPTLFWGYDFNIDFIRSIDIVPTAIDLMKIDSSSFVSDGISINNISQHKYEIIKNEVYNVISKTFTKWRYENNELKLNEYYRYFKDLFFIENKWIPIPVKLVFINRFFSKLYTKLDKKYLLL